MSKTPWASDEAIASLSKDPIGGELAVKVADRLMGDGDGGGLWSSHRDYCGHGLMFSSGRFNLIVVHDGYADCSTSLLSWSDKKAFCEWLGEQSDYSLSGADTSQPDLWERSRFRRNNQRLTKARMADYIANGRK